MTADRYLREVKSWLGDLPWSQRRDLLADLRNHLAELPPDTDLAARLGAPDRYAAEMRTAAGLERRSGPIAFLRARRPRNLIVVALLLTAIGLAIGTVVWVDSYEPLVYGNGTQLPLDSRPSSGQNGVTVTFRPGRPFLYGITIENNRRFAVRILGVQRDRDDYFTGHLFTNKPSPSGDERPLEPFHPFDLRPGEERWLVLKGVYACTAGSMSAGGAVTRVDIGVRYSFLWRTATTQIPLEAPLAIVFLRDRCSKR